MPAFHWLQALEEFRKLPPPEPKPGSNEPVDPLFWTNYWLRCLPLPGRLQVGAPG